MKQLITLFILALFSSISCADGNLPLSEKKFIPYTKLTKEEKKAIFDKEIKRLKKEGVTKKVIKYWEDEIDNNSIYYDLREKNIVSVFPQLTDVKQLKHCTISMTVPQSIFLKYEPKISSNNQVQTRRLECKSIEDPKEPNGVICQYKSSLAYYSKDPKQYFSIHGKIAPSLAIKIVEAWDNGNIISTFDHTSMKNAKPRVVIYKNGKYKLAYSLCEGNIPKAAGHLDINPSTIYRKIKSWED